jgi:hypothetical protein
MRTYENLVQLARMSARQAWLSSNPQVADLLWRMAKEYEAKAGEYYGPADSDIGDPPPWAAKVATERRQPYRKSVGSRAA